MENRDNYYKEWYAKNAESVRAKANTRIECECGMLVPKNNISRHKKSKKHELIMSLVKKN